MAQWKNVDDDSSPFDGVEEVDGLVYTDSMDDRPELRDDLDGPTLPPLPVRRPAPQRAQQRHLPQWKPGGDIEPVTVRTPAKRPNPLKGIIIGILPIVLLVFVVLGVMHLYGLR